MGFHSISCSVIGKRINKQCHGLGQKRFIFAKNVFSKRGNCPLEEKNG
jgi:hypothetical protein